MKSLTLTEDTIDEIIKYLESYAPDSFALKELCEELQKESSQSFE